jgi:hypothetical protein
MYTRLPAWMQARGVIQDNAHNWELSNGSRAKAFPTGTGDSYAGTLAIADEFDLVPDQAQMMGAVEPAVGDGGQMILLSRVDKAAPNTRFKAIYRAAKERANEWIPVFLPWQAHPERTQAWYEGRCKASLEETGSLDDVHEQYPASDAEALAPRSLDKRIPPQWLALCYRAMAPIHVVGQGDSPHEAMPPIPNLRVFRLPDPERTYVMGADPAEGLSTSDDSSLTVLDAETKEEVARLDDKLEPKQVFPGAVNAIGQFYNHAPVLVERNNHGHAVIGWLLMNGSITVLPGYDRREGWNNSTTGKVMLYDDGASVFMHGGCIVHDFGTQMQIGSIEKNTLRAPAGDHDDKSDRFLLALKAAEIPQSVRVDFV